MSGVRKIIDCDVLIIGGGLAAAWRFWKPQAGYSRGACGQGKIRASSSSPTSGGVPRQPLATLIPEIARRCISTTRSSAASYSASTNCSCGGERGDRSGSGVGGDGFAF